MKKKESFIRSVSLKSWIRVCACLGVIGLCVIALTGETFIGQILTYVVAYLFGMFYFPFFILTISITLYYLIRNKFLPWKGKGVIWTGLILLFLSMLCLSSIQIPFHFKDLTFTDVTSFYANRMKGFASSITSIDNFENIGSLGGGFIGLSIDLLLSSLWGNIGNTVFFAALILFSLFLLSYRPIYLIVAEIKEKRKSRVFYDSPYHPVKGKENKSLNRDITSFDMGMGTKATQQIVKPDPELCKPFEGGWNDAPKSVEKNVYHYENDHDFEDIDSIHSASLKKESSTIEKKEAKSSVFYEQVNPVQEQRAFDDFDDVKPLSVTTTIPSVSHLNLNEEKAETNPVSIQQTSSDESNQHHYDAEENRTVTSEHSVNHSFSSLDEVESIQEQSVNKNVPSYPTYPMKNPLEDVAKNVTPKSSIETTIVVSSPVEEVKNESNPREENVEKTKEEKEAEIAKKYFEDKQRKMIEEEREKRRIKMEHKAMLLRFVSDTPKFYHYALPTDALLYEHDDSAKMLENSQSAEDKVNVINSVFNDYGVKARAVSYTIGASVTRFNVETDPGEKSDRIASVVDELQRALNGDKSVRVETVVEGKNTSGIEVGNKSPMSVSFKDVFENIETNTKDPLLLPIGKDISGNIITFPLNKMPHILIAGTTGSGKSVLVHSMIMTLIMRNYPSQMKLILIDPKQVEFVRYQDSSHLFCPVISKAEVAVCALKKLCDEMERRFALLSKYRVANLEAYNELRVGKEALMEQMPYLVCIIDEFADLMIVGGKEVALYVQRIGQKARAAGIHMIIATQRPSKDSVPMMIKANIPCRIGLSCSSQVDSRVILDENGAETLLGKGDLLFRCPGKKSLIRAQSPFLTDDEISSVLSYVKEMAGDPVYDKEFIELEEMEQETKTIETDANKTQYDSIKDFIIHTGITSRECIMKNFQVSSQKAETYFASMISEGVLMMGYGGEYTLGPAAYAAQEALNKEKL